MGLPSQRRLAAANGCGHPGGKPHQRREPLDRGRSQILWQIQVAQSVGIRKRLRQSPLRDGART
eukprot:3191765-Lingulodinium_polyedra.AAC.1